MERCFSELNTTTVLPERMNCPYYYQPDDMIVSVAETVAGEVDDMVASGQWAEVTDGKMLGVLLVEDDNDRMGYLKAYSGQIGGREDWPGWVPAVFDYLQPDGHFAVHEREITELNHIINDLSRSPHRQILAARLSKIREEGEKSIGEYRLQMAEAKARRDAVREQGGAEEELIRESQYMKAELRRIKKAAALRLQPVERQISDFDEHLSALRHKRKLMSDELQQWLFSQFVMLNGKGERKTLLEIFAPTAQRVPPSGAGECCAPKLLQYAFLQGYKPKAIAEFWYGRSPKGEVRKHGDFYPACQGKCKPILDFMLQGVEVMPNTLLEGGDDIELSVIYRDEYLIVVDKPAGVLSVPGKGNVISVLEQLRRAVPGCEDALPVHRLDMQTSGVLMFALSLQAQQVLQKEFADRRTKKEYVAVVEGELPVGMSGDISLPLSPDYLNRPRQMVDKQNGKEALTNYRVMSAGNGVSRLMLIPHHGRTHQLRVHCAHQEGLGTPIVGDDLYGHHAERLLLHAQRLEIVNPLTGKRHDFHSDCPF